jgi:hypothetical protein
MTRPPPLTKKSLNPDGLTSVERGLDLTQWEYSRVHTLVASLPRQGQRRASDRACLFDPANGVIRTGPTTVALTNWSRARPSGGHRRPQRIAGRLCVKLAFNEAALR